MFKIFETDQFVKDLEKIDKPIKERIYKKIINNVYYQIRFNPYYGKNIKKLRAFKPETWRYRLGDLRIFYEIDDKEKIISIITIDYRGNLY